MARQQKRSPSATTAPKGRPTHRRNETRQGGVSPTLQWILVVLAAIVALTILVQVFGGGSARVEAPSGAPSVITAGGSPG